MSERMPGTGKERVDKDPNESLGKFAIPFAARVATNLPPAESPLPTENSPTGKPVESPPGKVTSMEEPTIDGKVHRTLERDHVENPRVRSNSGASDGTNSTGSDTQNSSNSTGSDNQIPDGDIEEPKRPVFPKPPKSESLVAPAGEVNDLSLPLATPAPINIEEPKRPVFPKPPKSESLVAPAGEVNDLSLPPLSKPKDYNQMLGDMKKDQLVNVSNPVKQDELKDRYASSEPSQRNQVTEDVAENTKP
jgi:hypothetical protein